MGKKVKKFDKFLQTCIDKKRIVKLLRDVTDGEADIYGYIVSMNSDFMLVHNENEFQLDGYSILQKSDFDFIRYNEYDETIQIINEGQGVSKKVGIKKPIKLKSWKTIFSDLKKRGMHVTIECEYLNEPAFYIGPLAKVGDKSVEITYYDGTGKLDSKPSKVKYKDISLVKFGQRYTEVFKKYVFK